PARKPLRQVPSPERLGRRVTHAYSKTDGLEKSSIRPSGTLAGRSRRSENSSQAAGSNSKLLRSASTRWASATAADRTKLESLVSLASTAAFTSSSSSSATRNFQSLDLVAMLI